MNNNKAIIRNISTYDYYYNMPSNTFAVYFKTGVKIGLLNAKCVVKKGL